MKFIHACTKKIILNVYMNIKKDLWPEAEMVYLNKNFPIMLSSIFFKHACMLDKCVSLHVCVLYKCVYMCV